MNIISLTGIDLYGSFDQVIFLVLNVWGFQRLEPYMATDLRPKWRNDHMVQKLTADKADIRWLVLGDMELSIVMLKIVYNLWKKNFALALWVGTACPDWGPARLNWHLALPNWHLQVP